jgi:topoisomerase-4 subunit A
VEQEEKPKSKKVTTKREAVTLPAELRELAEEAARASGNQPVTEDDVQVVTEDSSAKKVLKEKKQLDLF